MRMSEFARRANEHVRREAEKKRRAERALLRAVSAMAQCLAPLAGTPVRYRHDGSHRRACVSVRKHTGPSQVALVAIRDSRDDEEGWSVWLQACYDADRDQVLWSCDWPVRAAGLLPEEMLLAVQHLITPFLDGPDGQQTT